MAAKGYLTPGSAPAGKQRGFIQVLWPSFRVGSQFDLL